MGRLAVGLMFQRDLSPELIGERAELLESLGFEHMWVTEDLWFSGGIAAAATALAASERLTIGIGILPAMARNALFCAMELGTLARLHPGRLLAGLGHGMVDWMETAGAAVSSPVTALDEHLTVIGRLLDGETVDFSGSYVHVAGAHLEHLPPTRPPLFAGVRGPRSIQMAARAADGILLAEPTSPSYLRSVRRRLDAAAPAGARRQLACYTWVSVDDDRDKARQYVRPMLASIPGGLAEPSVRPHIEALPFADELLPLVDSAPDQEALAAGLRDEWIDELAVVGNPEDCARAIVARAEAGADRIALVPLLDRIEEQLQIIGVEVLPLLTTAKVTELSTTRLHRRR